MYNESLIIHVRNRKMFVRNIFRTSVIVSVMIHMIAAGGYFLSRASGISGVDGSELEFREFDVDIPPEFSGGDSSPSVKQEWVEGSSKTTGSDSNDLIPERPPGFGEGSGEYGDLENSSICPKPLFSKTPQYPDSMRKAGIEGVVVVELGISENGEVMYGKIAKSLGRDFDFAVIEWAKKIKFIPAKTSDKIPMKCRIHLPVRFKLEG